MEVKLVVVLGKTNKDGVTLKLPSIVGRSREADVTVAHSLISRRHCELYEADGLLMVRDLDSLNGTVVKGQRIREAALPPDAEFSVGPLTFRAEYEYDGDLDSVPPPELFDEDQPVARPVEPAAPPPMPQPQEDDARWGDFVAEMDDDEDGAGILEAEADDGGDEPPAEPDAQVADAPKPSAPARMAKADAQPADVPTEAEAEDAGEQPSELEDMDTEEIEQFTADSLESDLSIDTKFSPEPAPSPFSSGFGAEDVEAPEDFDAWEDVPPLEDDEPKAAEGQDAALMDMKPPAVEDDAGDEPALAEEAEVAEEDDLAEEAEAVEAEPPKKERGWGLLGKKKKKPDKPKEPAAAEVADKPSGSSTEPDDQPFVAPPRPNGTPRKEPTIEEPQIHFGVDDESSATPETDDELNKFFQGFQ